MTAAVHADLEVEQSVLGGLLLYGDPRHVLAMAARGLTGDAFYWPQNRHVFAAMLSLAERSSAIDSVTVFAELDRLGLRRDISRGAVEVLEAQVPALGHVGDYADRVIELAQWRGREKALSDMARAASRRDGAAWARAAGALEVATAGTRTDSLSGDQMRSVMFDYFATPPEEVAAFAVPFPFGQINEALGGGLRPGEVCLIAGPSEHGKSVVGDMWADHASSHGKRGHVYLTEMTFLMRGMRYLARQTGVPFMRQRLPTRLTVEDRRKITEELGRGPFPYGFSVVSDWGIDDVVRDALRARYDWVIVDLLHGFHYEDERGLDRLSKAMQRLARTSTLLDGHRGTAVIAVTHLKEEGTVRGKVPRPTIASLKGGSSLKQDADMVMFVWQEQDEAANPSGDGEIWLGKGRSMGKTRVKVRLNPARFRFELRPEDDGPADRASAATEAMPF